MTDSFHSVQLWSDPWPRRIKVVKMYDSDCLSGIGWLSLGEYNTRKAAVCAARFARSLVKLGKSDDHIFVIFGGLGEDVFFSMSDREMSEHSKKKGTTL